MKHTINEDMKLYLEEVSNHKVLTRDEEVALFERLSKGDEDARALIVEANLRFVIKIALQFSGRGVALPDLIQEGNIGLLEVVDKFDYKKGYRFSTYAAFWIRQSIQMALRKQSNVIRLPIRKSRFMGHLNEAVSNFKQVHGRTPTSGELSATLDVPEENIDQLLSLRDSVLSLDMEGDDEGSQLLNKIEDVDALSPAEQCSMKERRELVMEALKTLSDKERSVLELRFGFDDGTSRSLRTTSKLVGMSQEGVRRMERTAIKKLRRPTVAQAINGLV